mmetsp:Transcript_80967/g.164904  ORF Transcript_80967/g.164904 Transcript_80967/m.164904 type:complete len:225 (-) Transcript_80967:20-694(-)
MPFIGGAVAARFSPAGYRLLGTGAAKEQAEQMAGPRFARHISPGLSLRSGPGRRTRPPQGGVGDQRGDQRGNQRGNQRCNQRGNQRGGQRGDQRGLPRQGKGGGEVGGGERVADSGAAEIEGEVFLSTTSAQDQWHHGKVIRIKEFLHESLGTSADGSGGFGAFQPWNHRRLTAQECGNWPQRCRKEPKEIPITSRSLRLRAGSFEGATPGSDMKSLFHLCIIS